MKKIFTAVLFFLLAFSAIMSAANLTAIASAANFQGGFVAPGALNAAFGSFNVTTSYGAPSPSYPTTLGGATVYVNGVPAPLMYVGSTQINFQTPYNVPVGSSIPFKVCDKSGGCSNTLYYAPTATALASYFSSYCGGPTPTITYGGTNVCPASPTLPSGAIITLWVTGGGTTVPASTTGVPPTSAARFSATAQVQCLVGCASNKQPSIQYAGVAPGSVGGQINVFLGGPSNGTQQVTYAVWVGNTYVQFSVMQNP